MTNTLEPFAQYSDEPIFNIQAVAEQTDVPALTLRAWERRYDIPNPKRDAQGHRLYSERDIMIIHWLKQQIDSSMRIKQAVKLLYTQYPQHLNNSAHTPSVHVHDEPMNNRFEKLVDDLFQAIQVYDYPRAQMILTHALSIYSIEDVCLGVLIPVFQRIDMAYQAGEMTLQGEHFGSNLIRERLLGILTTPATPSRSGRIVVGCAPHEWHEIGPLMFSLFLRRRGWEVIYLGQNVGFTGLAETITQLRPDVFVLSITHLPNIRYLAQAAQITADATHARGIFTYAGRVFNEMHPLLDKFPGVYLGDDLITAVEKVEQLLNNRWRPPHYTQPVLNAEARAALTYLEEERGVVEGATSAILMRVIKDSKHAETSRLAQEFIAALHIALQYNAPHVLAMLNATHNATLASYGMDIAYLRDFVAALSQYFHDELPPTISKVLIDYCAWLNPSDGD